MSTETSAAFEAGRELATGGSGESHEDASRDGSVRFRATGEGYAYVTDTTPHGGRERPVYLHRLAAVAWGVLEGLDDPRHVHHCERSIPWLNVEENLAAEAPEDHYLYHLPGCEP